MSERFLTLGIESSCDDTSVCVLEGQRTILSSLISSQIEKHAQYGGVVPEFASRMHLEAIIPLMRAALSEAGIKDPSKELNLVAVTAGPGLMGSLLVGVMAAKAFAQGWNLPLIGVNHLEGHLFANVVESSELKPPFLCLIVSGGHTEIVQARGHGDYSLLGTTKDDAAGEAYDKVAKLLGLSYPGGPVIDRLAAEGNPSAFSFPIPMKNSPELMYSFSGLKTAVLWAVKKLEKEGREIPVADICASFQHAVTEALLAKLQMAVRQTGIHRIAISGGVAANSGLRRALLSVEGWDVYIPPLQYCTDNAVMVAAAGYNAFCRGVRSDLSLSPDPSWQLAAFPNQK